MTGSITASNGFSGSINGIGNVSEFSASIDSRIINNQPIGYVTTSSFETYTSSVDTSITNLNTISASYLTFTQSYYSDSSSFSNRIDEVNNNLASGAAQYSIYDLDGFDIYNDNILNEFSSSNAAITSLSASVYSSDGTLLSLINGKLDTASFTTFSTSVDSRLDVLETTYATTGSNTFNGTQTITGSMYVSGDLIIQGSSSLQNITASQLTIETNIVQMATALPSVRYAGWTVVDSGSSGVSASMLWDSQTDDFIFTHRSSGSLTLDSSMFIYGPLNSGSLDSIVGVLPNRLTKGENNGGGHDHHITSSQISDDGTTVSIPGNLDVTGSQAFESFTILSNVGQNLNFANDAAAAIGGVPLYGLYRSGNFIMIRLT
jgi:hypothetical protein